MLQIHGINTCALCSIQASLYIQHYELNQTIRKCVFISASYVATHNTWLYNFLTFFLI